MSRAIQTPAPRKAAPKPPTQTTLTIMPCGLWVVGDSIIGAPLDAPAWPTPFQTCGAHGAANSAHATALAKPAPRGPKTCRRQVCGLFHLAPVIGQLPRDSCMAARGLHGLCLPTRCRSLLAAGMWSLSAAGAGVAPPCGRLVTACCWLADLLSLCSLVVKGFAWLLPGQPCTGSHRVPYQSHHERVCARILRKAMSQQLWACHPMLHGHLHACPAQLVQCLLNLEEMHE